MLSFSAYETFWVLSSRLSQSRIPCKCNSNNASDEIDALYNRREEGVYVGQLNHLPSKWTQMLAEKDIIIKIDRFKFSSSSYPHLLIFILTHPSDQ